MQGNKGFNMEKQNHAPRKQHQHQQHPPPSVPANGQQANSQSESRARRGGPSGPALGRRCVTAPTLRRRHGVPYEGRQVWAGTSRTPSFNLQTSKLKSLTVCLPQSGFPHCGRRWFESQLGFLGCGVLFVSLLCSQNQAVMETFLCFKLSRKAHLKSLEVSEPLTVFL